MKRRIFAWLVVLLAMAAIAGGLGQYKLNEIRNAQAAAGAQFEPMEAVATARARSGEWTATTRAIGTVVATRQLELRNEIAGVISELGFSSGDIVEAGQLLVQFDVRQEQASLAAAEAEARLAKITLDRREALRGSPAFNVQEFDKSREELSAAESRARALAVAIEKKRITAPFRARVGITNLQPGAYLDVATLIVRLQGVDDEAFIDFALPQGSAAMMKPGASVALQGADIPGGTATAQILAEDDSINEASRTIRFRATARGLGPVLRPGAFVDVIAVTSEPQQAVFIPQAAVRRSPDGQHVFVIVEEDGKARARLRAVETGAVRDDEIVVAKGLASGDLIATSGSFKLRDGALVASGGPQAKSDAAPAD